MATNNGKTEAVYLNVYAKIGWLYKAQHFKDLNKSHSHARWNAVLPKMGINERVQTDHFEWIRLGRITTDKGEHKPRRPNRHLFTDLRARFYACSELLAVR